MISVSVKGAVRIIRANGVPNHLTGTFPNKGNPHKIIRQKYTFRIPARPKAAQRTTPLRMQPFGIAVNGVPFDPGAAEWYLGNPQGGWQYEPLSGAIVLGIDVSHAHVQPNGAYHYHGLPTHFLESLRVDSSSHSPMIGWAADGFPIYAVHGYMDPLNTNSQIKSLKSSYRLKNGNRPQGKSQPGGKYDGTFIADYEYINEHGNLDECNGRFTVTPEFPDGTYAYFLTESWPIIPRYFRGTPSVDFQRNLRPPAQYGRRPLPRRP